MYAGKFVERNNLKFLLQSFIDAKLSNDWFLLMVGDGKLKEELKSLVQSKKFNWTNSAKQIIEICERVNNIDI